MAFGFLRVRQATSRRGQGKQRNGLRWFAAMSAAAALTVGPLGQAQVLRDDFSKGTTTPDGWKLEGGAGRWEPPAGGRRSISVTGNGDDMSYWSRKVPNLKPGSVYALRFRAKTLPGSTALTVISGLDVCNRDFAATERWSDYSFAFTTPSDVSQSFLRLGQWHMKGTVEFSEVELLSATPVYSKAEGLTLGEGESVRSRRYQFRAPLGGYGSNSSRCLFSHTAAFNSDRWVFTGGMEVIYRHDTGAYRQTEGALRIGIGYYTGAELEVSVSKDGTQWVEIGHAASLGDHRFAVPASLYPASAVYVRLRATSATDPAGNSAPGAFQVNNYEYTAPLEDDPPTVTGATTYIQVRKDFAGGKVEVEDFGGLGRSDRGNITVKAMPNQAAAGQLVARLLIRVGNVQKPLEFADGVTAQAGKPAEFHIPYRLRGSGDMECTLTIESVDGTRRRTHYEAAFQLYMPAYFAADYGHSLSAVPSGELWWCESTYKVSAERQPPPQQFSANVQSLRAVRGQGALSLKAARREREHVQLILRPFEDPGPIHVSVTDLTGAGKRRIPASAIQVREVAYVEVTQPTDRTGVAAPWPDPIPPLQGPWQPRADRNNVLWITVTVPATATAGDYVSTITLRSRQWRREIPLKLHVWNFSLPQMTSLRSGFGVQPGNIARYHNLTKPEDMARVWDLYMEAFRKRRINPYNPMALAPYQLDVQGLRWNGGTRDTTGPGAGKYSLRISDDSNTQSVAASVTQLIAVEPGRRYRLSWMCRTAQPGQQYSVTLEHSNAAKQWIWGRNNDIVRTGSGDWAQESVEVGDQIPAEARYVRIILRPVVWTEKGENTGTAWFDNVGLEAVAGDGTGGQSTTLFEDDFETEPQLQVRMDFTEFDKAARRYLDGMGFNAFAINIQGLPGGRYPDFDHGSFFGFQPDTPEFDTLMRDYGKRLEDHLAQHGWLSKAYVYWYDEPEERDYPIVQEGAARLKKYFPRLKRMMTEQFEDALYGSVDLWCPITPNYNYEKARARQALGEEVWWYICTGPKEPYCTLFIDKPAIELRMWLWQTWQRQIQGILIWETTWWTSPQQFPSERVQNPWEDPMSYVADVSGVWGNGDGRFFYPPNRDPNGDRTTPYLTGPVDSIRWEMLGEGIEDWEYFRTLAAAVKAAEAAGRKDALTERARKLLVVPPQITSDLTHFTTDPQLLYRHRQAIAEAIEALQKASETPTAGVRNKRANSKASGIEG